MTVIFYRYNNLQFSHEMNKKDKSYPAGSSTSIFYQLDSTNWYAVHCYDSDNDSPINEVKIRSSSASLKQSFTGVLCYINFFIVRKTQ